MSVCEIKGMTLFKQLWQMHIYNHTFSVLHEQTIYVRLKKYNLLSMSWFNLIVYFTPSFL